MDDVKHNKSQTIIKWKKEHYKRVPLDLDLEFYLWIKELTEQQHLSVNGFIKGCIKYATENGYLGIYESYESIHSDSVVNEVEQMEKEAAEMMKKELHRVNFDF